MHTRADTILGPERIEKNTTFIKSKSPYVIQHNISVKEGVSIVVEKDVTLVFDGGSLFLQKASFTGSDFTIEIKEHTQTTSNFLISGSGAQIHIGNIFLQNIQQPFISVWDGGSVTVVDSDISSNTYITNKAIEVFNNSQLHIDNVSFANFDTAIYVFNSSFATITNSVFTHNHKAIYTHDSNIHAHLNDFFDNYIAIDFFLNELGSGFVDASENWWGDHTVLPLYQWANEVKQTDINALVGNIIYAPQSTGPHKKPSSEFSNVLFLPGLMGSRLYTKEIWENQLWEPNRNKDVKKLFLNPKGESIEQHIYTRDIIAKTNIVGGISAIESTPYKDFVSYMDELVRNNSIQAWKPAPYDWRYAPDTILTRGILTADAYGNSFTKDIVAEVLLLAKTSKTKKVTLITHSNGGLIGKQLMIELEKKGLDRLIDKIIFVAMPEYGTPQAITSLLYGHEQSIAGGLILNTTVAKQLGTNMPTAYTLIPSAKYLELQKGISIDGVAVHEKEHLNVILTEKSNINNELLHKADNIHSVLDVWMPPAHVEVYQIVGTGVLTTTGLMQNSDTEALPTYNTSGDGVVQDMYDMSKHIYNRTGISFGVDLHNTRFKHSDMMNATIVMKKLDELVRDIATTTIQPYASRTSEYTLTTIQASSSDITRKTITAKGFESTDVLKHNPLFQFDESSVINNTGRFDAFDTRLQYLSLIEPTSITIQEEKGGIANVHVLNKKIDSTEEVVYDKTYLFKDTSAVLSQNGFYIVLPTIEEKIEIMPVKKVVYDTVNNIREIYTATTTSETLPEKIIRIQNSIKISHIQSHIKTMYISRLEQVLRSADARNILSLQERVDRAIAEIDRYAYSPVLKGRYAKQKQSYIYIRYLLQS